VIDPGHGGHDTGTIGRRRARKRRCARRERRLGKCWATTGRASDYTRSDDTFISSKPHRLANRERADCSFPSTQSSDDPDARGVETYYLLHFLKTLSKWQGAKRGFAEVDLRIAGFGQEDRAKGKIDESREFARTFSRRYTELRRRVFLRNRGVKKAPFIVLIARTCHRFWPRFRSLAILWTPNGCNSGTRQQIAESLYRGVARYVNGLSGVRSGEPDFTGREELGAARRSHFSTTPNPVLCS